MSARHKAYIALLINALLWGIALPLVKLALPYTTPFRWLFYRYLFAAPASLPFLLYYWIKIKPSLKQLITIIILELIGTVLVLGLLYAGLKLTSALNAALISNTIPIFVTLGGILWLKEKQEKREWLGLSLAIAGTTILTLEPLTAAAGHSGSVPLLGNSLILLQSLIGAAYLLLAKTHYRSLPKLLISSLSFWLSLISFYILSLIQSPGSVWTDLSTPIVLVAALYMGILGSLVAATLYIYGQNLIEASEASLFTYLQPLISIPLSIWWLNDKLSPSIILGIIVIACGVYLAERRPKLVTSR